MPKHSKRSSWSRLSRWMHKLHNPVLGIREYSNRILTPTVDAEAERVLKTLQASAPPPVIWLLGKTQSGKSSIVRTLTQSTAAEVGNGFKVCTRTAMLFDFPDAETAFLRFLDTRGLSEVGYDAHDDMAWCERQAQLVMVVMKAMDHQQDAVVAAVKQIKKIHPEWPLLVVQTALHEGYPNRTMEHMTPYPFGNGEISAAVPADLRISLLKQRTYFLGMQAECVAIDFTQLEDGYQCVDYGVDALWAAIETVLPLGLRQMLDVNKINDVYHQGAHAHIISYSLLAGIAAAIPIPLASLSSVVLLQSKMFHSIASVYGVSLTRQSISELSSAIGLGVLTGMGGRELLKLIPFYGQTLAAGAAGLYSATVSYALGKTLCFYFDQTKQGKALSADALNDTFKQEFSRGGALLRGSFNKHNQDKR